MSVLVFIDQAEGEIKKASYEAICYAAAVAKQLGVTATGLVLGQVKDDLTALGKYGLASVKQVDQEALNNLDAQVYSKLVAEVAQSSGAKVTIFSNNADGKAVAPRVAVRLKAGLVAGAVALPDTANGFVVKKNVFSGKAFAHISVKTDVKVITLNLNAYPVTESEGSATVEKLDIAADSPKVKITKRNVATGEIPLPEAEIVVSGGRGLKGPENWGIVEDLAKALGAATACSRPVADADWRPHHEHVGQTGVAIAPNLYIAIGISGAIQHLAGVNRSKHIVVINKDPEAPFFKAADYGIVGDAFEVVPKITEAVKKMKGNS